MLFTGVCTFGHDLCGWTNSLIDDGEWQINSDDTASFETGPQYDSDGNGEDSILTPNFRVQHSLGGVTDEGILIDPFFSQRSFWPARNPISFSESAILLVC